MAKYLLPCECGEKSSVEISQAGSNVQCVCGRALDVPNLRELRQLELSAEPSARPRRSGEWAPLRGAAFSVSFVALVIGMGMSAFAYRGIQLAPDVSVEEEQELFATAVEQTPSDQLFEEWKQIRELGIGPRGQNPFVNARLFRQGRQRMLVVGLGLCAAGLLGALGAVLAGGKGTGGQRR